MLTWLPGTGLAIAQDGALHTAQLAERLVNKVLLCLQSYKKMSPFFIPYAITNMGSALMAIDHGFLGPNYSISTACATANYAFHAACMHIRNGEADVMIAGGSEAPIIPVGLGGFVACRCVLHHAPSAFFTTMLVLCSVPFQFQSVLQRCYVCCGCSCRTICFSWCGSN